MTKSLPTEAKVGIFVVLTVFALTYMTIRINRSGATLDKVKTIYAIFDNASGILKRTPIEYAGIRVGTVTNLELFEGKARVEMQVDPKVPLYQDSQVRLQNRGILGEKIITIAGGGREPLVADGGTIVANGGGGSFEDAMNNFNEIAQSVKDLLNGGNGKPSLKDIVQNVTEITEDLRTVVRGNKKNLDDIVQNVNKFTTMLNEGDLKVIIQNLKTTSETIKTFVADANPQLRDVVSDFKGVMAKIDGTVESLNKIVAKVDRGEGTLGKLLNDETTVNKVNDTLDGIGDFVGRVKRLEVAVGFRGEFLSSAHQVMSTASFKIQPNYDKYFLFEFTNGPIAYAKRDTTETTTSANGGTPTLIKEVKKNDQFTFTALFAKRFYDLTVLAGLFRSSAGIGAQYHLFKDHLTLGTEIFDFSREENMHWRAYAMLHLFKIFHVSGGVDDIVNANKRRNYFIGAGIMLTDSDLKALLGIAPLVKN